MRSVAVVSVSCVIIHEVHSLRISSRRPTEEKIQISMVNEANDSFCCYLVNIKLRSRNKVLIFVYGYKSAYIGELKRMECNEGGVIESAVVLLCE